jgi:GWxTD domain-containing protein
MIKALSRVAAASLALLLALCSGGPKIVLDAESEAFYEHARLIMTSEERDMFTHITDAATRKEFIEDFWKKRDPDEYTEENEFKTEFYRRIEYANKRFIEGLPGWKTDRGRIYIYMGPPDKFDESFTHRDPDVRGSILLWAYYDYKLGIEFVDARGDGSFRIRRYDGFFFEALDSLKMGYRPVLKGDKMKFASFELDYDKEKGTIEIVLPIDVFKFRDEAGRLLADLEFSFFVYRRDGTKLAEFREKRAFAEPLEVFLELKELAFDFPYPLAPGRYYIDVVIVGPDGSLGKTRKIFEVKA